MSRRKTPVIERDDKKDLYLEENEVTQMIRAAGELGRHGERDAAMIQIAYSHGLRASELCSLRWEHVNLEKKRINITRVKGSKSGQHWLYKKDVRALAKLGKQVGFVFKSESIETPGPIGTGAFWLIVKRAGKAVGLGSNVYPHQLRHACGHRLRLERWDVLDIQEWLGHRDVKNTQLYAQANADHFRELIERSEREIGTATSQA